MKVPPAAMPKAEGRGRDLSGRCMNHPPSTIGMHSVILLDTQQFPQFSRNLFLVK